MQKPFNFLSNFLWIPISFGLVSCKTTEYLARKQGQNFNEIKPGKNYYLYDAKERKTVMKITSTDGDSIRGMARQVVPNKSPYKRPHIKYENLAVAKQDIAVIKEPHPAGTVAIVAGSTIGAGVFIYYMLKAAKVFGSFVGGIH